MPNSSSSSSSSSKPPASVPTRRSKRKTTLSSKAKYTTKRKKSLPVTPNKKSKVIKKPAIPTVDELYKTIMLNPDSRVNVTKDIPVTSEKHDKQKKLLSDAFFTAISGCKNLAPLSEELLLDPEVPNVTIRKFYKVLQGDFDDKKFKILDECLHVFMNQHRLKNRIKNPTGKKTEYDFEYQPSSVDTKLKTLFGIFKSNGIKYGLRDFEKNGTFLANLYYRWKEIAKVRDDFGTLPYQSSFDCNLDDKLTFAVKNKILDYQKNYNHFLMLIIQLIGKSSMLRGPQEHADLEWSNIKFSTVSAGEFKGRRTMEIVDTLNKTHRLKLGNTHRRRDDFSRDVICICEENPHICVPCKLLEFKSLCDPKQKRLYCYKHAKKNPLYNKKDAPISNPRTVLGHTKIDTLMKSCARICQYDPSKRTTCRGLRSFGITELVNSTEAISEKDKMKASRHKNLTTHVRYQRSSQGSRAARYKLAGARSKNPEASKPAPTSNVPSLVSLSPRKNEESSISSALGSNSDAREEPQGDRKQFSKPKLATSPFMSSSPYPIFHPGYTMPGSWPMPSLPAFSFPPPGYGAFPQAGYPVQDHDPQNALREMQNVVADFNEKLQELKAVLKKKE